MTAYDRLLKRLHRVFNKENPTGILQDELQVFGRELDFQSDSFSEALKQLYLSTAEQGWLDQWGAIFGVPRLPGETDAYYRNRIAKEIFALKVNNIHLAALVFAVTGYSVDIVDGDSPKTFKVYVTAKDTISDVAKAAIKAAISRYKAAGSVPAYYAPSGILYTSTADNHGTFTNNAQYVVGPKAATWELINNW